MRGLNYFTFCERNSTDDVLDLLLDQEGLEVDPIDRLDADTPLHKSVRFCNKLSRQEWESGSSIVELLLDAGADPRYACFFFLFFFSPIFFLFSLHRVECRRGADAGRLNKKKDTQ